jgi:sulfide dehydrogenase [flavocytochrome c] flavoprotein chain
MKPARAATERGRNEGREDGMTRVTRRGLLRCGALAAGAATLGIRPVFGQATPKVVVIGGGAGGATLARYLALDSEGAIEVTLVEPKEVYTTCFHSNLYLGGVRDFESISHTYDRLTGDHGITHVREMAEAIDRDARQVRLADGVTLDYDHLVVAPGIEILYDRVEGYSPEAAETMPHAWLPGEQTRLLRDQLTALEDGATIVMVAPPNPYRCPPGPYERVSMMAHVLKGKGHTSSRIIVLDAKESFSKQALFQQGWERHYPGMVEWQDPSIHGGIGAVDADTMTVETDLFDYEADLVNVIPPQAAGRIAADAGLADDSGYCPIVAETMRSTEDPAITILGDATIAGDMPKSAFSANSQAKVAANAIRAELTGSTAFPARYANTCWSLIDTDDAVKVGGSYQPQEGRITAIDTFLSQPDEDAETRRQTQVENMGWYAGITADIFG